MWVLTISLLYRLSEWSEDSLVMIHWSTISLVSLIMVSIFCTKGHGICRPQPLFFYLKNSWQKTKFQCDPVSLIFTSSIIVVISVLQILIEIKKRKLRRVAEKAARDAEAAKRNIDKAKLRLQNNETLSNNAELNPDSNLTLQNQLDIGNFPNTTSGLAATSSNVPPNHQTQDNALKAARVITFFAVLPTSIFLFLLTLENMDEWRPHGATASTMIVFGIITPVLFLMGNSKLRKFAVNYLKDKYITFREIFKSGRVEPIISINV